MPVPPVLIPAFLVIGLGIVAGPKIGHGVKVAAVKTKHAITAPARLVKRAVNHHAK